MTLEQNQHGTFFLKGKYETKGDTAGGTLGFPLWKRKKAKEVAKKK